MNTLIEQGIVREIESGNNFEYIVSASASFIDTDYKVLQSQSNDVFVKCMKITRNGQIDLCYLANEYRTVSSMVPTMNSELAIELATNLLECIDKVKTNGFLSVTSIVLDTDRIFVDGNTMKVKLVYIPTIEKLYATNADFEEALRNTVRNILGSVVTARTEKLEQMIADVADSSIPLDIIYQKGRAVVPERVQESKSAASQAPQAGFTGMLGSIKLVATNAPYPFEISISGNDVLIGKKAGLVDKVIDYNNAISRRHCRIIKQNGIFYIIDEGSANGTFVNNVRLEQGNRQMIKQGDTIRLANSDFRVD